jgi:hypothetical protein
MNVAHSQVNRFLDGLADDMRAMRARRGISRQGPQFCP